jgi:predicted Rdx family selenoprotein
VPKFVIERDIPGAGRLGASELVSISQKSCAVLNELGPKVQWVQSYVTDDKVYCIYIASDAQAVLEHAKRGGFPANRISEVRNVIDPTTAELGKSGVTAGGRPKIASIWPFGGK